MGKLRYTYALQFSQDVLRYAKVIEFGLYGLDNVVDDRTINGGLNERYIVIKGTS